MNVPPFEATGNQAYGAVRHTVSLADLYLRETATQKSTDCADLDGGKFRAAVQLTSERRYKAKAVGVPNVLGAGHVLKVGWTIVPLVSVAVVDLGSSRAGSNECRHDEVVDRAVQPRPVNVQDNADVSEARDPWAKKSARVVPTHRSLTPDAARVRHGVNAFVPNNGEPAFGGKFCVSHREPPTRVPVVRLGWDVDASRRAAFIFAQNEVQA